MKTIFRVSVLGLLITAFSVVSAFAQDPCADTYEVKTAQYQIFKVGRPTPRTLEKTKTAVKAGEDFVAKYGACEDSKQVVDFINKNLPEMKEWVKKKELIDAFDNSIKDPKTLNADVAFSSGKQLSTLEPADSEISLNIALVHAAIGFDNATKATPDNKFNSDAINAAKFAIKQLESGKTTKTWGYYSYIYTVKNAQGQIDHVKSKANALAWMNYTIGTIMYYGQKQEKDALPYFYKAAQFDSEVKKKPVLYQAIGAWYLAELLKIDEQRLAKVKENGDKDNEETLAMLALEKGYAERGIDAYARAHQIAKDTKQTPAYITSLYEKIQGLYKLRFDKADGIDAYISTIPSKPLPDPSSAVTPVKEETPVATTTTTTTTNPSTTPTPTTTTKPPTTTTKPATDTTTKPATTKPSSTTTKPAATTGTSTKGKINAKPKRKGTR